MPNPIPILQKITLFTFFALLFLPAAGQPEMVEPEPADKVPDTTVMVPIVPRHIVIGAKPSPPFLYQEAGRWTGISYHLWHLISKELNITFDFREMPLPAILDSLESGGIDLCINPLTVTSDRIQRFGFTQPFYASHSAVAAHVRKGKSTWDYLRQFFSFTFLKVILLLILILLIFGFLVWVFERKANPEEFTNNLKGLWSGMWWSAVTMTTVGYGDKSPRSFGGRMVGLIWMFTAVIIISSFTASITSALTVDKLDSDIEELADLRGRKVGTVRASASSSFMKHNYIRHRVYDDIRGALEELEQGNLEAFVFDEPILRYYIEEMELPEIRILPLKFNPQYYSFSVPRGSGLLHEINPVLLSQVESMNWKLTLTEYGLGDN